MKIYDISQEVFSCQVFPGDPAPELRRVRSMESGSPDNLSAFSMCAHNGTHVDAPAHFLADGATVEQIPLERFTGWAWVHEHRGEVTGKDAAAILRAARSAGAERILIKGDAVVSLEAARVFAAGGILLLGNASQPVGPGDGPMAVHLVLLGAGVVLLEGIRLGEVPQGRYLLNAAPLNLGGAEGAPCRAWLLGNSE